MLLEGEVSITTLNSIYADTIIRLVIARYSAHAWMYLHLMNLEPNCQYSSCCYMHINYFNYRIKILEVNKHIT